jgi:hypothetical protein
MRQLSHIEMSQLSDREPSNNCNVVDQILQQFFHLADESFSQQISIRIVTANLIQPL